MNDIPETNKLRRELRAEALARLEDAARTPEDFEKIIELWDKLDANHERMERYHEISRGDNIPLDYGASENYLRFPRKLQIWKQIQKGEFIDAIYNCPYEIHELVTEPYLSKILQDLSDEQKELLYYIAIKGYSTAIISKMRGQTDRNIRKVRNTLLNKIRKNIFEYLESGQKPDMTIEEKRFLSEYKVILDKTEQS